MKTIDYLRYRDLERYLFSDVSRRFRREGSLGAFDLFSIVVWKANRAKSKVASRLMSKAQSRNLEAVSRKLTATIYKLDNDNQRLVCLRCEWGLGLPMASAILSVCYPRRFSVYDVRVCEELRKFKNLSNLTKRDRVWPEYKLFVAAVRKAAPTGLSLRDCDRFLWARSGARQLEKDIRQGFPRRT